MCIGLGRCSLRSIGDMTIPFPKKLDRYIGGLFLRLVLIILIGVIALFIIVNFFENIDKFISKGFKIGAIIRYYMYQVPYIAVLMMPVSLLLSTFFSIGELSSRFEIMAVKASGISMKRFVVSIFIISAIFTGISMYLNMYIVGTWMKKSERVMAVEIEGRKIPKTRTFANDLTFISDGRVYYFRSISALSNRADAISMVELSGEGNIKKRIDALYGTYNPGEKKWILHRATVREFSGDTVRYSYYNERVFEEITESPFDFLRDEKDLFQMNVDELKRRIETLRKSGFEVYAELTELYSRYSFPFMNLIIIIFAVPVAAAMRKRGKAWGFGISVMLVFIYWGLSEAFKTLGAVGKIDPIVAAWAPNLFFLIIAIPMWFRIEY